MPYDKNQLQTKLLDNLTMLHAFFQKHDIPYVILGGTLLGAVRHQGFIPWDDDIDIGLPRPAYEKLLSLQHDIPSPYRIATYHNDDAFFYPYAKSYDTSTTATEDLNVPLCRGVWVDIFPLDGTFKSAILQRLHITAIRLAYKALQIKNGFHRKAEQHVGVTSLQFLRTILKIISNRSLINIIDKLIKLKPYNNAQYIANLVGRWGLKEVVPQGTLDQVCELTFERTTVHAPAMYDYYLTHIYGNYKTLPPVNKRISQHNLSYINLERSYIKKHNQKT